ncbi:MAG: hypothetical protein HRU01_17125 [Myxococcales bacterium]|nr:hypothetical protein [Myxococcales bacterium]
MRKYLDVHAEPEAAAAAAVLGEGHRFGHVVCLPAFGEGRGLLDALASVPAGPLGETLTILVVNEAADSPDWARESNRSMLEVLRRDFDRVRVAAEGAPMERFDGECGALLLIDRTAARSLPPKQGVGLARKIAADVALRLWAGGGVEAPWIHCTDADAVLPADALERPLALAVDDTDMPSPSALLYDFEHVLTGDPDGDAAVLRYEIFLRYYVLGLRSAGSPWAHQSIGSTIAVAPDAYAGVRGFPRRLAGEDFHLLAKLAKLAPLRALRGEPIRLSGRVSRRVPFGTGVGVATERRRIADGEPFPAYDPRTFDALGVWLATLSDIGGSPDASIAERFDRHSISRPDVDAGALWRVLLEVGAVDAAEAGRAGGARRLHQAFDALRTLRLVHAIRDRWLPALPLETAIAEADFLAGVTPGDLAAVRARLAVLEAAPDSLAGTTPVVV